MLHMDSILSGKSFMFIKKNRRPSTDPWGTPDLTSSHEEVCPFSTKYYSLIALNQVISKQGQHFAIKVACVIDIIFFFFMDWFCYNLIVLIK